MKRIKLTTWLGSAKGGGEKKEKLLRPIREHCAHPGGSYTGTMFSQGATRTTFQSVGRADHRGQS